MKPREIFGVAVRLLAVWFWTQAAYWIFWAAAKSIGHFAGDSSISPREDICVAIFYALLGVFLMSGARSLVWLAYGDAPKPPLDADAAGDPTGPSGQDTAADA
ncbi:MAG TPA: hypothetical protein VHY79_02975 [Rhizomicrobium sp.]|jgi:hypothetical protein|nr:hypothetical protein [Rhizomicrobium sp.]